jgi:dTMP kinase
MNSGKFIVLEGIDGCGKTTQIKKVYEILKKQTRVMMTKEPYITKKNESPAWYADKFVSNRKKHLKECILPAINAGIWVLCDRYKYSTFVYQQRQGIPFDVLEKMHEGLLIPDLVIFIDCNPATAYDRKSFNDLDDVFNDNLSSQKIIREMYLDVCKKLPAENIVVVDGNKNVNVVTKNIMKIIKSLYT